MDDEKHKEIDPHDLYVTALLSLEGTLGQRALQARLLMVKYPHVEGLRELAGRHADVLRTRARDEQGG